jgi:hypothetical protein
LEEKDKEFMLGLDHVYSARLNIIKTENKTLVQQIWSLIVNFYDTFMPLRG